MSPLDPTDIECGLWFKEKCMFTEPPEAIVTICRATGSNGEFLERTYYYERISKRLQGDIETIDLRVFFKWKQSEKTQEMHEVKMP